MLKLYDFPQDVIDEANNIYKQLGTHLNRKNHNLKVLFCVYNAYLNLDMVMDILLLAHKLKIPQKKVKNVFKLCSPIETGYQFKQIRFTIKQYAKLYLDNINDLSKEQKNIIMNEYVMDIIEKNDNMLVDEKPQSLAAAIIIYFLEKRKLKDQLIEFKQKLYRRITTINPLVITVGNVLNKSIKNYQKN